MIPILLLVSVATFILVDCTAGDPARVMLQGSTGNPSEESVQLLQQELGLDQPKIVQYFQWLGNVLRFNFGNSYVSSKPVIWELLNRVPVTLGIAILGIIIVLLISIPLGILAAIRKNTWLDHVIQIFSVFTVCVPAFWLGLGLLILFGIVLHSMNIIGGAVGIWIWVPALSIALGYTGQYIGLLRDNMIDVLEKENLALKKQEADVTISYDDLFARAKSLGMKFPTNCQVQTYTVEKSTAVRLYGEKNHKLGK